MSVYPNLLARDPGALRSNAASLAALLGASEGEVQALLRKEPGLLSYNMSTLATRWSYTMQVRWGHVRLAFRLRAATKAHGRRGYSEGSSQFGARGLLTCGS